ncbi:MAG TPA: RHS repeat-associated core domain-containing protein [Pyrinomonadaceae bacterium]|nr:RHS repeat-associated core domain-containing protein [Pyrinomonadaceae bacterium]
MGMILNVSEHLISDQKDSSSLTSEGAAGNPPPTPIETAVYAYDELSRLASAVNNVGTVSFTYDNRGRLKTETDVFGHVTERVYDAANRRTQLKLDGSVHTTYNYDNANRLTTLTDEASQNFTFGYDVADRLISKALPNGVNTTYEYDGMSRLKRLKDVGPSGTLFDRQYGYDTANQISQIIEPSQTRSFGYDNIDRLTSMTNGMANESYAFDAVGNRTSSHLSSTYSYQPFNKIASTQTANYGSDQNGNMTTKAEGSNLWRYTWDYENRLSEASTRKQRVRYKYDALGRRVRRTHGAEDTKFSYDGLDVVMDDDSVSGTTKYQNGLGIDSKLSLKQGASTNYFLADHLGSTNALTDNTGATIASQTYDSFGNPTNSSFPSRYQFTGREYDPLTKLQYSRARFYDPKIGRFISEDPIGFGGGDINLYGYVRNQPSMLRDPSGEIPVWDNFWYWHYAKQCAQGGVEAACSFNPANQSQDGLERMAQAAFDSGSGSVSGLRFRKGYGDNEACRKMEYYSGEVWADAFPTNMRKISPDDPIEGTAVKIAQARPASKLGRAWDWVKSWF